MNHEEQVWTLLDRYCGGECDASETAVVEAWSAKPENARTIELVRRIWTVAGASRPHIDEAAEFEILRTRIAGDRAHRTLRLVPPARQSTRRLPAGGMLAAAAVLLIVGIGLWQLRGAGRSVDGASVPAREYVTARAQRAEVMLVDGTRAWLNVDSRLEVLPGYGSQAREVALDGEAFFVVEHDTGRPFRVRTQHGITEVTGTEFGVRSYADDPVSVVAVSSGRVLFGRTTGTDVGVPLSAGDVGRLGSEGAVTVEAGVDVRTLHSWRNGRLDYDRQPLGDVLRQLERWYDLEIQLEDSSLADTPVTASFTDASADQALAVIAGTLDVGCSRDGQRVRLSSLSRGDGPACRTVPPDTASPTTSQPR